MLCKGLPKAGIRPLSCHFYQSKAGETMDHRFASIRFQRFSKGCQHLLSMPIFFHIDKVNENNPSQIAQTNLSYNFRASQQILLQGGLFNGAFSYILGSIHINGC